MWASSACVSGRRHQHPSVLQKLQGALEVCKLPVLSRSALITTTTWLRRHMYADDDAPAHANSEPLNLRDHASIVDGARCALCALKEPSGTNVPFDALITSARQRQRSSTASTSCSGCRHGCMECDPCGLLMASDVFENWSWHKLR